MQHVDTDSSTLTEEVWQEVVQQRPAAPEAPWRPESRVARFFSALAASMALQQRQPWSPARITVSCSLQRCWHRSIPTSTSR